MAMVRVLSLSRVSPPQHEGGRVKIFLPPAQLLFLYPLGLGVGGNGRDEFPAVVSRLKAALADTLTRHLPCAGRLDYEADTGHIVVDCSDAGVAFVEAEAVDGDGMDVRRLAYDDEADNVAAFVSLVPEVDARMLPAPVMSVQVTRLGACGLAVGVSIHHAVVDGRAIFRFVEAWAAASSCQGSVSAPVYRRDALRYPRDDDLAREWLNITAPNLPVVVSSSERDLTRPRLARRTFHLGADAIRSLKRRIDNRAAGAGTPPPKPVTTFVALAALCWTALVRSKGLGAGDDTYLVFLADLRARLHPPLTDAYLGNCIRDCVAGPADAEKIAGILHAARAVQAAVEEMEAAPVPDYDEALSEMARQLPSPRLVYVTGSPWFQAYQGADFGFGKPARAEVVSMNKDGEIVLLAGRRGGEVQLSVSIHPTHMPTFKACILAHMPSLSRI